jgi:hypothetical protein
MSGPPLFSMLNGRKVLYQKAPGIRLHRIGQGPYFCPQIPDFQVIFIDAIYRSGTRLAPISGPGAGRLLVFALDSHFFGIYHIKYVEFKNP